MSSHCLCKICCKKSFHLTWSKKNHGDFQKLTGMQLNTIPIAKNRWDRETLISIIREVVKQTNIASAEFQKGVCQWTPHGRHGSKKSCQVSQLEIWLKIYFNLPYAKINFFIKKLWKTYLESELNIGLNLTKLPPDTAEIDIFLLDMLHGGSHYRKFLCCR